MVDTWYKRLDKCVFQDLPHRFPYQYIGFTETAFYRNPGRYLLFFRVLQYTADQVDDRLLGPLEKTIFTVFHTDYFQVFDNRLYITFVSTGILSNLAVKPKGAFADVKFSISDEKVIQIGQIGSFYLSRQVKSILLSQGIHIHVKGERA